MTDSIDTRNMSEEEFLANYHQSDYLRPSFTADTVVFCKGSAATDLKVLLVQRGNHPFRGCWALPGGFVEPEEDADTTALRELREETGIADITCEQLGVYSKPGRDPRGWTATSAYVALLDDARQARAGDDAAKAIWCPLNVSAGENGRRLLEVKADGETLRCLFEEQKGRLRSPRARVVECSGFAFDHAQIVADAFLIVENALK